MPPYNLSVGPFMARRQAAMSSTLPYVRITKLIVLSAWTVIAYFES